MIIPEGDELDSTVKVVKPLEGVANQKMTPIIQDLDYIYWETNPSLSAEQKKNKENQVIRISNLLMPSNDYLLYMWNEVKKHLEGDEEGLRINLD